jgi:4-hydroxybenzoate polyprenyltransferase
MIEHQVSAAPRPPLGRRITANRWWIYQRERFPLLSHGLLIAVFACSTVSFSLLARGVVRVPPVPALLVAVLSAFGFFVQMRIADEFKDAADDARYRPYRPVPRGLVTLRELGHIALFAALAQSMLALWLSPRLLPLLLLVWGYLLLMTKEFFAPRWLRAHPITYMWTHMLILPLIDLYATACDWRAAGVAAPVGLAALLAVSFWNGFGLEIGRKVRAPGDEEPGVETYSALWGRSRAIAAWCGVLLVTAACALAAAGAIQFVAPVAVVLTALLAVAGTVAERFLRHPVTARAKAVELTAGIWTLLLYLSLGAVPLAIRLVQGMR